MTIIYKQTTISDEFSVQRTQTSNTLNEPNSFICATANLKQSLSNKHISTPYITVKSHYVSHYRTHTAVVRDLCSEEYRSARRRWDRQSFLMCRLRRGMYRIHSWNWRQLHVMTTRWSSRWPNHPERGVTSAVGTTPGQCLRQLQQPNPHLHSTIPTSIRSCEYASSALEMIGNGFLHSHSFPFSFQNYRLIVAA